MGISCSVCKSKDRAPGTWASPKYFSDDYRIRRKDSDPVTLLEG